MKPIGKKIQSLVVNVALVALLVTSAISIVSMSNVRQKNREVLITQMETNLYNTIKDKYPQSMEGYDIDKYISRIESNN